MSLQEGPQDLMHGDQGTLHDSHVPWKMRCKTMKIQEEDRGETQHHVMRRAHLYPFLEVITPRKVIELRSGSMDRVVHPCIQSSSNENVSLSGDITPRMPLV